MPKPETKTVIKREPVYIVPPAAWLQDCPVPKLRGQKNEHLVDFYFAALDTLERCNDDKRSIREYVQDPIQ